MRIISFRDTVLFKRGFWMAAAALIAAVGAPSMLDGSLIAQPLVHLTPLVLLAGFWVYFIGRMRIVALADEVIDCGSHLQVRRGAVQDLVPLSTIASAEVLTVHRLHRISLRLRAPTRFGERIEFWPPASLWGNLRAVQRFAQDLARRAQVSPALHNAAA